MEPQPPPTNEPKQSWFSDFSWKSAIIFSCIAFISGGSGGGIVASKGVAAQNPGISQDAADIRYLTKDEAERWRAARSKQVEDLDKTVLKRDVFEAYHSNDEKRMERLEKMVERILENQNR